MENLNSKAPKAIAIVGQIVKVDNVEAATRLQLNGDALVVSIQTFEGEVKPVWFAENQIDEFGLRSILFMDNIVAIEAEERIEGETAYVDSSNVEVLHTATLTSGRNASHAGTMWLRSKGFDQQFCNEITALRNGHESGSKAKTVNFKALAVPTTKADMKKLIADLEAKAAATSVQAYKAQYATRITALKEQEKTLAN